MKIFDRRILGTLHGEEKNGKEGGAARLKKACGIGNFAPIHSTKTPLRYGNTTQQCLFVTHYLELLVSLARV